jgi:hypothetical protein
LYLVKKVAPQLLPIFLDTVVPRILVLSRCYLYRTYQKKLVLVFLLMIFSEVSDYCTQIFLSIFFQEEKSSFSCRYCWRHGITPRHSDIVPSAEEGEGSGGLTLVTRGLRMSLTFRRTMSGQCECNYPRHCNRPR